MTDRVTEAFERSLQQAAERITAEKAAAKVAEDEKRVASLLAWQQQQAQAGLSVADGYISRPAQGHAADYRSDHSSPGAISRTAFRADPAIPDASAALSVCADITSAEVPIPDG